MKDVKLTNIPSMNIGRIVDDLTNVYSTVIKQKMPVKSVPSVMLWGAPGVGKSQAVRQIAKEINFATDKITAGCIDWQGGNAYENTIFYGSQYRSCDPVP